MKCKIIFEINKEPVEIELDLDSTGSLIDDDIIKALKQDTDKRKQIANLLWTNAVNYRGIKRTTLKDLKSKNGLVGNCTVDFITNQPKFQGITFLDTSANILLVDNLQIGRTNIKGRIINSQGQELFIVKNDKEDIQKLANFLNTRKHLQESEILLDPNSIYKEQMDQIIQQRNKKADPVNSYAELILDFIYNKSNYNGIFVNGNSAASILNNIWYNIKDWSLPISYNDKFINNLNQALVSLASLNKNNTNIKKGDYYVSFDRLYELLKDRDASLDEKDRLLSKLNIKSVKDLRTFFSRTSDSLTKTEQQILQELNIPILDSIPATILHPLFDAEPDFTFSFKETTKSGKGIILYHEFENIRSKYGIEYNTIASMDIINDDYKGYKIYKQHTDNGDRYFVSRGYLIEQSQSRAFNSEDEAMNYINNSLRFQSLGKNSLIEFKLQNAVKSNDGIIYENALDVNNVNSNTSFLEGQIIEILDIPIAKNTYLKIPEELRLSRVGKLSDFQDYINNLQIEDSVKQDIINTMNTPEKAMTFLYKVQEQLGEDRTNSEKMKAIQEQINAAGKKYYYIDNKEIKNKRFIYRIIPTEADTLSEYQSETGKTAPVRAWMNAISQVLKSTFGINIYLKTSSEVAEMEIAKDKHWVDPNTDKAFIYNGEVYINTTIAKTSDLLHEYVHIILGCIKSNPDLGNNYEQLMRTVAESDTGKKKLNELKLIYPDINTVDLMEEVFADMFSDYIRGRITPASKQIFEATEDDMKKITKSIFNTEIGNIKEFYGKNVFTIFSKFYKEIAKLMRDNYEIDKSTLKLGRKCSNYISQLIKKGEIQEEC